MWQCVARGNIHSPEETAFTLWAHAALSGECDYYLQYNYRIPVCFLHGFLSFPHYTNTGLASCRPQSLGFFPVGKLHGFVSVWL